MYILIVLPDLYWSPRPRCPSHRLRSSCAALAKARGSPSTSLNRLVWEKQGLPRQTTVIRLIRALGRSLTDERAEALLAMRDRIGVPLLIQVRRRHAARLAMRPTLKQLKIALLRAVEHVAELEEIVDELDDKE